MPSRIKLSIWSAGIGISGLPPRFDEVAARLDGLVLERLADRRLVDLDARRNEVAEQLADHVLVAGFREAHLLGRPMAEQAVAARDDLELHLLIAGILGLKSPLAVVEGGHGDPLLVSGFR